METLAMCVYFAKEHNLKIYVDWTDPVWVEGFYKYFSLENSLSSLDEIPEEYTVSPIHWKGDLKRVVNYEDSKHQTENLTPVNADVVVWVCGWRNYYKDLGFFASAFKVTEQRIVQKVRERQQTYQLSNKIGIHLRGTDRARGLSKAKRFKEMNLRMVSMGSLRGVKFVAISDDSDFIEMWKRVHPNFPVVSDGISSSYNGTHYGSSDKHETNINLIVDFFTLASCSQIVSTMNDSRFTRQARKLHPHVNQILN